jgi:hypothetical protein
VAVLMATLDEASAFLCDAPPDLTGQLVRCASFGDPAEYFSGAELAFAEIARYRRPMCLGPSRFQHQLEPFGVISGSPRIRLAQLERSAGGML